MSRRGPYAILADLRAGRRLEARDIAAVAAGAASGAWSDAQLGAFLMAAAIRGLDGEQTLALTRAMLDSGERWDLSSVFPQLGDKHSTGGVGDKTTLIVGPLAAAAGLPMAMLTGRGLGHTGGTADKLEAIPGIHQELDRARALELLASTGLALGIATAGIAPADRKLYALRDRTATVDSLPLIVASILSKKLATGAAGIVFDVKVGDAAFLPRLDEARQLATSLVEISRGLGIRAVALLTDMNQPLGDWAGHACEVAEALDCLAGRGPRETVDLAIALARELGHALGVDWTEAELRSRLASGAARECFVRWAVAQGAQPGWFDAPELPLAPFESVIEAPRAGWVGRVATRRLGHLLADAGAARPVIGADLDPGVSLRYTTRLGRRVEPGDELARLYLRREDPALVARVGACIEVVERPVAAPPLIVERVA